MTTPADALPQLLKVLTAIPGNVNDQIFAYLAPVNIARFNLRYARLKQVQKFDAKTKKDKGRKARLVGLCFEHLIRGLLQDCLALTYSGNVRTTTAEIDFLVGVTILGQTVPFLKDATTHILGEAKCHDKAPKAEWIHELAGLVGTHSTNTAVLFLGCSSRKLRHEIRYAIALNCVKNVFIIPFGTKQLTEIAGGANFLKLLHDQAINARVHSSDLHV